MVKVLFVCLGNICRSPTAEGVFRRRLEAAGLQDAVQVDSAGTHDYHIGKAPDPRAVAAAARRGIDISGLRARQVTAEDLEGFDYVLAMDEENLAYLQHLADGRARPRLLMDYAPQCGVREVPDPYFGGRRGFERVLDMLEQACDGLVADIRERLCA